MKSAKTILLGLACLVLCYSLLVRMDVQAENARSDIEALLENGDFTGLDSDDLLSALASAVTNDDTTTRDAAALARIAQLEQFVADRDAIILQLSNEAPAPDVTALQRDNEQLAAALAAARAERDQIREDFNRLFEGADSVPPEAVVPAPSAEDEALRERLRELENRVSELTSELRDVADERDVLARQVASADDVDDDWQKMLADLAETRAVLESLHAALDTAKAERATVAAELQQQQELFEARLQELQDENQALVNMQAERATLTAELQQEQAQQEAQLLALQEEKQSLAAALEASERKRLDLETARDAIPEDVESIRAELASLRALDASRRVTMDELMLQVGSLREALQAQVSENAALQEETARMRNSLADRDAILVERNDIIDELRETIDEKDKLLAGAWEKVESQATEMGALRGELREKETALAGSLQAREQLQERFDATHAQLTASRASISELEEEISQKRNLAQEQDAAYQSLARELERTLLVEERRRRVLDETLGSLADVEEREAMLRAELEASAKEIAGLQEARDVLQEAHDVLQTEKASLVRQAENLQERLDTATGKISDLRVTLADRDTALSDTEAEYAALRKSTEDLQGELAAVQGRYESVRAELRESQQMLAENVRAMEAMQSEKENIRLVDDRRRRTLDETLTALALAEQKHQELQVLVDSSEEQLRTATEGLLQQVDSLARRNQLIENELVQMEAELVEARQRLADMASSEDEIDDRIAALEKRNTELQALLVAADSKDEEAPRVDTAKMALLEEQLAVAQQEIAALQEVLQQQDAAATTEGTSLERLQAELKDQRERAEVAAAQSEILLAELEEAQQALAEVMTEKEAASNRAAELDTAVATLQRDTEATEERLSQKQEELQRVQRELEAARRVDIRETDLYRELEADTVLVREKLVDIEAERQRLQRTMESLQGELQEVQAELRSVQDRKAESQSALASANEREIEYRELLDRLVPEVRELEQKVTELRRERELMASRLLQREDDIASLHVELEQREHRLARAERVAEVLERTRSEVEQAQRQQRLNMHFNMAAVYARDGRFAEAEYEYLQALRLDPSDADVHFNLAILYDDELGQPDKAILHYRRYLQLNPHGVDADRVRSWLLRLEMDQRR